MGFLSVLSPWMVVVSAVGMILLFVTKDETNDAVFLLVALLAIMICLFNAASYLNNYFTNQFLGYLWGILVAISLVLRFGSKRYPMAAKILLASSLVLANVGFITM